MKYDYAVYNAKIYSLEEKDDIYRTMLISQGEIRGLFKESYLPDYIDEEKDIADWIDGSGCTILPAYNHSRFDFSTELIHNCFGIDASKIAREGMVEDSEELLLRIAEAASMKGRKKEVVIYKYPQAFADNQDLPDSETLYRFFGKRSVSVFDTKGLRSSHSYDIIKMLLSKKFEDYAEIEVNVDYSGKNKDMDHNGVLSFSEHKLYYWTVMNYYAGKMSAKDKKIGYDLLINKGIDNGYCSLISYEGLGYRGKDTCMQLSIQGANLAPFKFNLAVSDEDLALIQGGSGQYPEHFGKTDVYSKNAIGKIDANLPNMLTNPFMLALKIGVANLYQVLRYFTVQAPRALDINGIVGTLGEGKKANFIVYEKDPFECSSEELKGMEPIALFIEGRKTDSLEVGKSSGLFKFMGK